MTQPKSFERRFGWVWEWDHGIRWDSKWGIAVIVECTYKNRIGLKLRLGPLVGWCWWTNVYTHLNPHIVADAGTPLLFGQPVGQTEPLTPPDPDDRLLFS